jgi:hypothetical protein
MTRLLVDAQVAPCSQTELDAVRHAREIADLDRFWLESFSPDAFLNAGRGARVEIGGHDGVPVGEIFQVVAGRDGWHHAELDLEVDETQADLIHVGVPVSIDARSLQRDDDHLVGTRRHRLVKLDALAIGLAGAHPGYEGATIVAVRKLGSRQPATMAPASAGLAGRVSWRDVLPAGYEGFSEMPDDYLEPGMELLVGHRNRGAHWDGERFTVQSYSKAARDRRSPRTTGHGICAPAHPFERGLAGPSTAGQGAVSSDPVPTRTSAACTARSTLGYLHTVRFIRGQNHPRPPAARSLSPRTFIVGVTVKTTDRGLGNHHQQPRRGVAPTVAGGGAICCLCGQPILVGTPWDLDHTPDRRGYRGVAHASCNRSEGARRGNAKRGQRRSRVW